MGTLNFIKSCLIIYYFSIKAVKQYHNNSTKVYKYILIFYASLITLTFTVLLYCAMNDIAPILPLSLSLSLSALLSVVTSFIFLVLSPDQT